MTNTALIESICTNVVADAANNRQKVIAEAVARGMKKSTASTLYAKWKRDFLRVSKLQPSDTYDYRTVKEISDEIGESNDCVVKAIAIACGVHYRDAHAACEAAGRVPGRGMYRGSYWPIFDKFGYELVPAPYTARTMRTVERELQKKYRGVRAIVHVNGHVAAFDGARIQDWAANSKKRVTDVHLVIPQE